ncbi:MAG: PilW family protein [Gammaproteobacteria bacterium]
MLHNKKFPQTGQKAFSLIELLIGVVVGLIAVAATVAAFTSLVRSNADYLKMVRLNQELNAIMTLMVRDIKRAGYSASATGVTSANSFMTAVPLVFSDPHPDGIATHFQTLQFGYDANDNGLVDSSEQFGYRYYSTEKAVRALQTTWQNISDENSIIINDLIFVDDNLSIQGTSGEQIRYIAIRLSGELPNDPAVARTLTERVRVRNDKP